MQLTIYILFVYLLLNLGAFLIYGSDKRRARKGKERTRESTLLIWALFGAFGAYLGMRMFHHKTRKTKFILVPLMAVLHFVVLVWFALPYVKELLA